jgi:X-X-X-Leu-X-X-Gly heptad repeat protein
MSRKLALALALACSFTCAAAGTASAATAKPAANTKTLTTQMKSAQKAITALQVVAKALQGDGKTQAATLATVVAGVPSIVDGLTQLKDGLTQLKDGLTKLGSAYSAVEYGEIRVLCSVCVDSTTGAPLTSTPILGSADIPDDGNTVSVAATIPMVATGAGAFKIVGSIRSAESDGVAGGPPAGQAGGVISATCASPKATSGPTAGLAVCAAPGAPAGGGGVFPPGTQPSGTLACAGQTPSKTFTTPTGDSTQTLVDIPLAAGRTDQSRPSTVPDPYTFDVLGGGGCSFPGAGLYMVNVIVQFVDIPTSLSPGPTD